MKVSTKVKTFLWIWILVNSVYLLGFAVDTEWQRTFGSLSVFTQGIYISGFVITLGCVVLGWEALRFRETARRALQALILIDIIHTLISVPSELLEGPLTIAICLDYLFIIGYLVYARRFLARPQVKSLYKEET